MPPSHHEGKIDIPLDIIELIMEKLAEDKDMEALKRSSLTCRSFRSICQQHIFATIKLDFSKPPFENPLASRFRQLADRKPFIASYVRTLEYVDLVGSRREAPVLRQFSRVNAFTFGFKDEFPLRSGPPKQDWDKAPTSLQSSLYSFIQANNITQLYLFNIGNFPKYLLLHLPALSLLGICRVNFTDSSPSATFIGNEVTPKLSFLIAQLGQDLLTVRDLLGWGLANSRSMIDIRRLKQFVARTEDQPAAMRIIGQLLKATESIESLMLSGRSPTLNCLGSIASALSPKSLKTLKTIGLSLMLQSVDIDPYLGLTKELEAISGRNVLEQIVLDIAISIDTDRHYTISPRKWGELDVVLSVADGFPLLHRLEVTITLHCYCHLGHQESLEKVWDIGRSEFPRLVAAGKVEFIFDARIELL